jgi:hypothetical protein
MKARYIATKNLKHLVENILKDVNKSYTLLFEFKIFE